MQPIFHSSLLAKSLFSLSCLVVFRRFLVLLLFRNIRRITHHVRGHSVACTDGCTVTRLHAAAMRRAAVDIVQKLLILNDPAASRLNTERCMSSAGFIDRFHTVSMYRHHRTTVGVQ